VGSETGEDREMCGKKKVDNVGLGDRVQYIAGNTPQHSTVQHSTIQYSTAQYRQCSSVTLDQTSLHHR
jgi:hypothetical protein